MKVFSNGIMMKSCVKASVKFVRYIRTLNNTDIGQMKISKFTKINKQTILTSAKQTTFIT